MENFQYLFKKFNKYFSQIKSAQTFCANDFGEREEYFLNCNKILTEKILKDYCIAILPTSLEEALRFFDNKKALEKTNKVKVFPIIEKSYAIVASMRDENDYLAVDSLSDVLRFPIMQALCQGAKTLKDVAVQNPNPKKQHFYVVDVDKTSIKSH